jgi:deoxyhypusine synthase
LVRKRLVHAIITTIGALDHDLARSWKPYYQGDFTLSDEELLRKGMHRLGNLLIPFESYGKLIEEKMRPFLKAIYQRGVRDIATYELCELMGKEIARQDSMLYWAAKKGVPIVVPGPLDGAVGSQLWLFQQVHHDFRLNLFKDQELLSELVFKARRTGGMIIGGGISKHHLLWWNQFRNGLDYAVQITSAVEWDGSLSGARLGEAVSWKKVATHAKKVDVWGDATIIFPIIVKAALERLGL